MSPAPNNVRQVKGGLVLVDPGSLAVQRTIALQYNPESISRTLAAQATGNDGPDHTEALRLKGPPVETIRLEAELDATDQLNQGDAAAREWGIQPQLAVLEMLVYPASARIAANRQRADSGALEILPVESLLVLLVWSEARIIPVRVTDVSITEESFDIDLNPLRARVALSLRVLNVNDLGFDHRGSGLFLTYQRQKERLAELAPRVNLAVLGIGGIG